MRVPGEYAARREKFSSRLVVGFQHPSSLNPVQEARRKEGSSFRANGCRLVCTCMYVSPGVTRRLGDLSVLQNTG
jgi:hypothetical protein